MDQQNGEQKAPRWIFLGWRGELENQQKLLYKSNKILHFGFLLRASLQLASIHSFIHSAALGPSEATRFTDKITEIGPLSYTAETHEGDAGTDLFQTKVGREPTCSVIFSSPNVRPSMSKGEKHHSLP